MSNYHILTMSDDGNSMHVVAHFAVPNTANDIGVNYRTALIQSLGGEQTSSVPFIAVAEQTALDAGELLERSYTFNTYPAETTLQKRDRLDALWETQRARVLAELAYRLSYWGYSRDVA